MKTIGVDLDKGRGFSPLEGMGEKGLACVILTCRPNIINSNGVIIKSPEQIVVIDPGGAPAQGEYIKSFVLHYNYPGSPVYILLTHCHLDHSYNFFYLLDQEEINFKVIMNQACADIFSGASNRHILLEDFLAKQVPQYMPDIVLPVVPGLAGLTGPGGGMALGAGEVRLACPQPPPFGGGEVNSYRLTVRDLKIDCLNAPGHSPDSTCYRVGDVLLLGDIMVAANTGIAGTVGWSPGDLKDTVRAIYNFLGGENSPDHIVSGHGPVFNKTQALKVLKKVNSSLQDLTEIKIIDNERKEKLIQASGILLKKSEEMFAALGGRLHRIEYYLQGLEENAVAEEIRGLIDNQTIDNYISNFGHFARGYKEKGLPGPAFFLMGIEFVSRLKKIFQGELLNDVVDPYYLRLCQRLIDSYLKAVAGSLFKSPPPFDPLEVVREMVEYINRQKREFDSMPEDLEDEALFVRNLIQRLSHRPLVTFTPDMTIIDDLGTGETAVYAEREAIEEILYSILDYYARNRAAALIIKIYPGDGFLKISIDPCSEASFPQESLDFYNMLLDETGNFLSLESNRVVFNLLFA